MNGTAMTVGYSMDSQVSKNTVPTDKSKQFQMELLMEKLRTKSSQYKSLVETSKAVRMTMLDKRWALDSADKSILQKCLDSLQHCIKVCSLQSLVERLECLSRQLGLKFTVGASGVDLFISSDMFYLEILLEPTGAVKDVKIHHEGKVEQQSCEELVSCISRGDFADFTAQLEGLTAVYQLNAEKKVKCKAFTALSALETDLGTLALMQSYVKEPWAQVHKTQIGFVQKRRGGHAMRLTYFVSPYDIIQCQGNTLTIEALTSGIGLSAQVQLESAAAHKLQLTPLISQPSRSQTSNVPVYAPLGPVNSITLPARFILKLSKPIPICGVLLQMMNVAGESESIHLAPDSNITMKPLLTLIAQNSVSQPVTPSKGLFVTLHDQNQCYFLTESRGLDGCMVETVPFTHPRQVPVLIARLRQQAVFNALIASCVRPNSKQDLETSVMVEISALSWQHISVMLEQPGEGGMATLEIELPEGNPPHVSLHAGNGSMGQPDEKLARVLARSLSIPLTVRALLARWERESHQGFSGGTGGLDPGGAPPEQKYSHHQRESQQNNISMFGNQDNNLASLMGNGSSMSLQGNQMSQLQSQQIVEEKRSKKRKQQDLNWNASGSKKHKRQGVVESSSSSDSAEDSDDEDNAMQSNSSNDEEEDQVASPSSQIDFGSDLELSGLDPAELIGGSSNDNKTSCSEYENSVDGEISELQEMEEMIRSSKSESKKHRHKNKDHSSNASKMSTSSLLLELTEGSSSMVPSALSITPVSSAAGVNSSPNFSSVLGGMGLDRRPSIASLPSSITITPITPSQAKSMDERHRSDKKSSSSGKSSRSSSSDRFKEKKKKKRREDSMGPPGKLPLKQDSLGKPISSSMKSSEGSHSPLTIRSSSPNTLIRKFSPSPTHGRSGSSTKTSSGSPGSIKGMGKPSGSSSHHNSPRHSPVQCSPKHTFPGYSSPKNHGTSSPKHSSTSTSTGKPSMSTLKSATSGSPSSKSSSSYELSKLSKTSSGKDGSSSSSREKERKSSGLSYSSSGSGSPKLKSSSVKLKQLDLSSSMGDAQSSNMNNDTSISPGLDLSKSSSSNQLRNRKGSLSAVIDKLKSAQHCGTEADAGSNKSSSSSKDRTGTSSNKLNESKSTSSSSSKMCDSKTQEYMVKPSSDGMKITINKTRTKESSNSSSTSSKSNFGNTSSGSFSSLSTKQSSSTPPSSSTGSPKTHTGLKPGVISGPASKKPQVLQSTKSTPSTNTSSSSSGSPNTTSTKSSSSSSTSSSSSKVPFMKSSSGSNLSSSSSTQKSSSKISTGSPKMSSSSDPSKSSRDKDKVRSIKSSSSTSSGMSEKSIFSSSKSGERRLSPAPSRDDVDGDKSLKSSQHNKDANFTVEGLIKSLDTSKYQIPKLSARMSSDDNKAKNLSSSDKSTSQTTSLPIDNSNIQNRTILNESAPKLLEYMGRQQDMLSSKFSFQHLANSKLNEQKQPTSSSTSKPIMNLSGSGSKLHSNPISMLSPPKITDNLDSYQATNMSFSNLSKSQGDSGREQNRGSDTKVFDMSSRSNTSQHMMGSSRSSADDMTSSKLDFSKNFSSLAACNIDNINQKQMEKSFSSSQKKSPTDEMNRKFPHGSQDLSMKPPQSVPKHSTDGADVLLDFSSTGPKNTLDMKSKMSSSSIDRNSMKRHTPPLASPSLSVHIVKSPAQSPLVIPSPHSNSPCITDDELMDEAVVGPGK